MNRRKNLLIITLCLILLVMGLGYSAFSSKLDINSSSSITSNWDVEITSIEKTNVSGNVVEKDKSFTKDSASFSVEMEKPRDYVYYKIGVTNKGNLAAIATLGNLVCSNDAFECGAYADSSVSTEIKQNTDLTGSRLIIGSNETEYYNVYIKFKEDVTEMPSVLDGKVTLSLLYKQSDVGITHKDNCYTGKVLKNGTLSITDYDTSCGTDVVIPETIDGYTVTEISGGRWDFGQGKTISPFSNKGITSVTMPDTVVKVGDMAFRDNSISILKLSENIKEIGGEAFANNKLTSVDLYNVSILYGMCFYHNDLTNVNIPSSVTIMDGGVFTYNSLSGDDAFIYGLNSDGTIDYTVLNSYAGKNASDVIIPSTVKIIDYAAFRNVYASFINVPSTVVKIYEAAFWQSRISSVKLNEGLKYIDSMAFLDVPLVEINIPNSVETIGSRAFEQNKLTKVTIGTGVKSISANAFKTSAGFNPIESITINQKEGSISGSPWGATNATINWLT